jgi:copper(I)-binding protein
MRPVGVFVTSVMLFCCIATTRADDGLQVTEPWIREAPPGASVMAGYMTLSNTSDSAQVIESISSPVFEAVEIHRSWVEDGIARMQPVTHLAIPAGDSISLAPGGYHLMLLRPGQALAAGDEVTLLLHRADGACVSVTAPVVRQTESPAHQHQH